MFTLILGARTCFLVYFCNISLYRVANYTRNEILINEKRKFAHMDCIVEVGRLKHRMNTTL